MYLPPHFREDRLDVQHALIDAHPLGALVTMGPDGLVASHIPFIVDASTSPLGTLRAHVSRANPHWKALDPSQEALVIFQGADSYVSPSWYPTKNDTGKVVPSWNYVVVHVYGRARAVDDPAWVGQLVARLTTVHEAGQPEPWSISDAPEAFIAGQLKGIVGIEIEITRIEGKWKVSQNRPEADRVGVAQGLIRQGDERSLAMAELIEAHGD